MYVCGITPYDATHMGHAATYVTFDVLGRALRDAGHDVLYVQNVTDVDEPLLERAERDGVAWRDLAGGQIALFREDMTALRRACRPTTTSASSRRSRRSPRPSATCSPRARRTGLPAARATAGRRRLLRPVAADPASARCRPGRASRCSRCSPTAAGTPTGRASATRWTRCCGGPRARASRPGTAARSAGAARAGTSSAPRSRWTTSGMGFDVQGGGTDLVFPHHEMSAVQRGRLTGESPFARALRPPGDGRPGRREDEQVQGQPGAGVRAAAGRAWTRWPSGSRCWPTTTARLGLDRPGPGRGAPGAPGAWRARVSRQRAGRTPRRRSRACASAWPTTWTPRARWRPWTAGPREPGPRRRRPRRARTGVPHRRRAAGRPL